MGVAPTDNPQVVVLVTLYNPTGEGGHQGGGVAAPVGGQIFSEILPYLAIEQGNKDEVEEKIEVVTPDITGKTIQEAEKLLKDSGLQIKINSEYEGLDKNNMVVLKQLPLPGIKTYNGSCIYIDF